MGAGYCSAWGVGGGAGASPLSRPPTQKRAPMTEASPHTPKANRKKEVHRAVPPVQLFGCLGHDIRCSATIASQCRGDVTIRVLSPFWDDTVPSLSKGFHWLVTKVSHFVPRSCRVSHGVDSHRSGDLD